GPEIPTELYIDVLDDSVVVIRSKQIREGSPHVGSLIKRIGVLQNRILMMMSKSAIERYQHFVETYPDILQRVPQRMVASYLGVTPETLSAAKASWRKKSRETPNS
ncbi:MAG: Crp/Fnr family transcriptional regulator, partial [Bacteroidota bacterium]